MQAASTYASNHGADRTILGEVFQVAARGELPSADLVVAGPPSTGLSRLGPSRGAQNVAGFWHELILLLGQLQPRVFLVENVRGFLHSQYYAQFLNANDGGLLKGYHLTTGILAAQDFGVPQRRHRAVLVGSLAEPVALPRRSGSMVRTVRDAIADVPWAVQGTRFPDRTTSILGAAVPGPFSSLELHVGRRPTAISIARYECVPSGGSRLDIRPDLLPACWARRPDGRFLSGTADVMGRMVWDEPAPAIRTEFFKPEKGRFLHPQWDPERPADRVNRPITHWEAARLQGFDDAYRWCGTKPGVARQIGNAVPPPVALALGRSILQALHAEGDMRVAVQDRLPR